MDSRSPAPSSDDDGGIRTGKIDELNRAFAGLHSRLGSAISGDADVVCGGLTAAGPAVGDTQAGAGQIAVHVGPDNLRRPVRGEELLGVELPEEARPGPSAGTTGVAAERRDVRSSRTPAGDVATADRFAGHPVTASLVEALVALDEVGRMTGEAPSPTAATGHLVSEVRRLDGGAGADETPGGSAEFQVDVASDYEHERLLMYRVILAFEVVAAIVLIREIALRLL